VNTLLLAGLGTGALILIAGANKEPQSLGLEFGDAEEPHASKGPAITPSGTVLPRAGEPLPPVAEGDAMDVAQWHADMDRFFSDYGVSDVATAAMVTYLPKARDVDYSIPDPAYWENMAYTLEVLRQFDLDLGTEVEVRGYRPPWYNEAVGGAGGSTHQYFSAIDLWPKTISTGRLHDEARELWHDRALHETGIGMYANNIHVDTRRGRPASWGSRKGLL